MQSVRSERWRLCAAKVCGGGDGVPPPVGPGAVCWERVGLWAGGPVGGWPGGPVGWRGSRWRSAVVAGRRPESKRRLPSRVAAG